MKLAWSRWEQKFKVNPISPVPWLLKEDYIYYLQKLHQCSASIKSDPRRKSKHTPYINSSQHKYRCYPYKNVRVHTLPFIKALSTENLIDFIVHKCGAMDFLPDTNKIYKVGFTDQLWIDSDEFSLEIELISHQKEKKVHLQNEFENFICNFIDRPPNRNLANQYM